jgi:hypothetical protein
VRTHCIAALLRTLEFRDWLGDGGAQGQMIMIPATHAETQANWSRRKG